MLFIINDVSFLLIPRHFSGSWLLKMVLMLLSEFPWILRALIIVIGIIFVGISAIMLSMTQLTIEILPIPAGFVFAKNRLSVNFWSQRVSRKHVWSFCSNLFSWLVPLLRLGRSATKHHNFFLFQISILKFNWH